MNHFYDCLLLVDAKVKVLASFNSDWLFGAGLLILIVGNFGAYVYRDRLPKSVAISAICSASGLVMVILKVVGMLFNQDWSGVD